MYRYSMRYVLECARDLLIEEEPRVKTARKFASSFRNMGSFLGERPIMAKAEITLSMVAGILRNAGIENPDFADEDDLGLAMLTAQTGLRESAEVLAMAYHVVGGGDLFLLSASPSPARVSDEPPAPRGGNIRLLLFVSVIALLFIFLAVIILGTSSFFFAHI